MDVLGSGIGFEYLAGIPSDLQQLQLLRSGKVFGEILHRKERVSRFSDNGSLPELSLTRMSKITASVTLTLTVEALAGYSLNVSLCNPSSATVGDLMAEICRQKGIAATRQARSASCSESYVQCISIDTIFFHRLYFSADCS